MNSGGIWGGAIETLRTKVVIIGTSAGSVLRRNRRDLLKTGGDTVTPFPNVEDGVDAGSLAVPSAAAFASSTLSSEYMTSTTTVASPTTTALSAPRVITDSIPHLTGSGRTVKPPVRFNDYFTYH
jgi:hypothetical protein